MSRIVVMQNGIFITFYQELSKNGFLSALISTLDHVWTNMLWIVLLFLIFISLGFIFFILFYSRIDLRMLVVSQIVYMILVSMLTNFSSVLLMIALSLFIGVLWEKKNFEPAKDDFSTGYSVINARLWLMSVFLCIGIFLILYMNFPTYEQEILRSNKELMLSLLPGIKEVKEEQKKDIVELTEGFKSTLAGIYNSKNESLRTQCKPLYEDMTQALDSYRDRTVQKIEEQELGVSEEDLSKHFPFFNVISQITPLLIALSGFAFFTVLNPIIGVFGGILYSLIKKSRRTSILPSIQNMEQ
ncbi:MAG: hypothetical protein QMD36_06530 [Candidatus Aenigmarchaeota archaeon]|nr:hypothetical protein [Candidatus Aenigmarchaeota archaeon]